MSYITLLELVIVNSDIKLIYYTLNNILVYITILFLFIKLALFLLFLLIFSSLIINILFKKKKKHKQNMQSLKKKI